MLSNVILNELKSTYTDRTLFLIGCKALGFEDNLCYYDIAVYPGNGLTKRVLSSEKVIIIPINSKKGFLRSNTKLLHGLNFDYYYIVEDDRVKYYRMRALEMLNSAMHHYLLSNIGGNSFLKASLMNTLNALLLTKKIEPASSHIFKQITEISDPEASSLIEALGLDENMGSMLKARSIMLVNELDAVDSTVFYEKINWLTVNNRQIEASAYFYQKLSQLADAKLEMINRDMKFGLPSEKDQKIALNLIKTVSDKVSKLI